MSKTHVFIQCRLSSTRLPGKALLPVHGIPVVVLCGLRVRGKDLSVKVLTSVDRSDDLLPEVLKEHHIPVHRGPLDDVFGRFLSASEGLQSSDVIVRLTADNVFPDRTLINEMLRAMQDSGREYVGTGSAQDGLPYGLSAEAFTIRALRNSAKHRLTPYDREHVTPSIINQLGYFAFRPASLTKNIGHLRCTLDTWSDYLTLQEVFRGVKDPITISWVELCERLEKISRDRFRVPLIQQNDTVHSRLTLGTAQLGMEYGASNKTGKPAHGAAVQIVRQAVHNGVLSIDTARAYEDSERIIGEALPTNHQYSIITKLYPHDFARAGKNLESLVDASVFKSLAELRLKQVDAVLLHRWAHRTIAGERVWKRLLTLKKDGFIKKLGASVQNPREALEAIEDSDIAHIQMPFSIVDWRWEEAGLGEGLRKRPDIIVHARSVLLQGLLTSIGARWPAIRGVNPSEVISQLDKCANIVGRKRMELCFAYITSHEWITSLVVGMETPEQLMTNLKLISTKPLTKEETQVVRETIKRVPSDLLNPAKWKSQ